MVTTKSFTLYTRTEYFKELTRAITAAKKGERVVVATMALDPTTPLIRALIRALRAAAKRGAVVTVLIDAFNFLISNPLKAGPLLPGPLFLHTRIPTNLPERQRNCYQAVESLRAAGATCCITNVPLHRLRVPQSGRSHIKAGIISNTVFVGGCNLSKPSELDVMIRLVDADMADTLSGWLERIAEAGSTRRAFQDVDAEVTLGGSKRLLLDAGVPDQSLIYEEAITLIDEAKEWIFMTCQYFPGGTTAKHLAAAQARGVAVDIVYSHPSVHGTQTPFHHLHQLRERVRHRARLFAGQLDRKMPNLHAKVLASERAAIVGSHNYVAQGVTLGTAELALHTTDPDLALELRKFIEAQLALQ